MPDFSPRELGTTAALFGAVGTAASVNLGASATTTLVTGVIVPTALVLLKFALELNRSSDSNRKRDNRQDKRLDRIETHLKLPQLPEDA